MIAPDLTFNFAFSSRICTHVSSTLTRQTDIDVQARLFPMRGVKSHRVWRLVSSKTHEWALMESACCRTDQLARVAAGVNIDFGGHVVSDTSSAAAAWGRMSLGGRPEKLPPRELDLLLRHGALQLLREGASLSETASKSFAAATLEQVLRHNVRAATWGVNEQGFLVVDFEPPALVQPALLTELAVSDNDFWTKMLPGGATAAEKLLMKVMLAASQAEQTTTDSDAVKAEKTEVPSLPHADVLQRSLLYRYAVYDIGICV